jgi:phosphinothricin acetyltransferase
MPLIRLASESDLPAMLQIYNEVIINTTAIYQYNPQSAESRELWFRTKREEGFKVFIAESEGKIAGFSTLGHFRNWPAYKYSVENSVYVDEYFRNQGIGKLLLSATIDAARELNMHTMVAGIDDSNSASIRLHEKLGFVEVAYFKEVGYKFGRWLNLKFLQLILDTPLKPIEG